MQTTNNNQPQQYRVRINKYIRAPQVRVILADGSNGGIMDTQDALRMAQDQNLDLIEINPKSSPPVCRIANSGQLKYEEKKKLQIEKRKQQVQELKEITFRPVTDTADLLHKLAKVKSFLEEGHRVRLSIRHRGREMSHQNISRDKIEYCLQQLDSLIQPNPPISMEGKIMSVLVSPNKQKIINEKENNK